MAHEITKRQTEEFLTFPLRFNAQIELIGDAVAICDWIVGYPSILIPGEEGRWIGHSSFGSGADASEDFLSRELSHIRSHHESGEMARRFLLRNGTFRQWDWYRADEVLRSGVPKDVKRELTRVNPRPGSMVYILAVKQFYQEWELLRLLALIAGKLAEKTNPLHVKSEVDAAKEILRDLDSSRSLPPLRHKDVGLELSSIFGETDANKGSTAPVKQKGQLSLGEDLRVRITSLYGSAFHRGIGEGKFGVGWGRFSVGPRVALNVRSSLGHAYLGLLSNFSRGWKCCGREDCGNIFRITDDRRKKFCSQYCGHLVSLRNNRKKTRRKKGRSRARDKEGKQ
jgi:hypothetical protein